MNHADTSGLSIAFTPGTDAGLFNRTINDYLSQSAAFREIYAQIYNSDTVYTFDQIDERTDHMATAFTLATM